MTVDELRSDLLGRWKQAFDRREEVNAVPSGVVETVYTTAPAFTLDGWSKGKLKPGTRIARTPPTEGNPYMFALDASGRPLHVRYSHAHGEKWAGVFRHQVDEVERLDICLRTGVPNLLERIVLSGDLVLSSQRFVVNMAGTDARVARLSPDAKIDAILADPYAYFLYLTLYSIEDGVTRSAVEHHETGGKVYRPTQEHLYAPDGSLQRVVQHWPGGEQRTLFAAKTKATSVDLADTLSKKIAAAVLKRLRAASFAAPLVAVELSYRLFDNHVPQIIPLTADDDVKNLTLAAEIDASRWIPLAEEEFAPELTEFDQRVRSTKSGSAVAKMLRASARLVTDQAPAELRVAEGFVAFAIDWEIEGDDLAKILKQCGATPKRIATWRKSGWL